MPVSLTNPLVRKIAGGLARTALAALCVPGAEWLIAHGLLPAGDRAQFVASLSTFLAVAAWSAYSKNIEQLKLLIAASLHDAVSESEVEDKLYSGDPLPKVTTSKYAVPSTPGTFGR